MMTVAIVAAAGGVACVLHLLWIRISRPDMSVAGKHVLITGGSQGLGKALAELCYKKGAKVTIVARTKSKLEQTCAEIRKTEGAASGADVQFFTLDISSVKSKEVSELMQKAAETFGRVDVFVSNAGTGHAKLLVGPSLDEIDELLDSQISTNLMGGLRCATAAAHTMASDGLGGRVSIVSSAAGLISLPGYAVYSATKFGHRGFLAGAYHELRQHGVHLSVYYPGTIRTPGYQSEQEVVPDVTNKIEGQCSDIASAESAAGCLLQGIERGTKEITNELLPAIIVEQPTGCAPIDAAIASVMQLIRAGWAVYLGFMCKLYVKPLAAAKDQGRHQLASDNDYELASDSDYEDTDDEHR